MTVDFMIGAWKGGDLPTGHRGDGFLGDRWFGTTFTSAIDDNAVIAVTNGKGARDNGRYMYFYLERL